MYFQYIQHQCHSNKCTLFRFVNKKKKKEKQKNRFQSEFLLMQLTPTICAMPRFVRM